MTIINLQNKSLLLGGPVPSVSRKKPGVSAPGFFVSKVYCPLSHRKKQIVSTLSDCQQAPVLLPFAYVGHYPCLV